MCLLLRLADNLLALGLDARKLLGIRGFELLDFAVGNANSITFLLPIATVARNLTQLTLNVDMVAASLLACSANDIFGQTDLASNLDRERTTRLTHFEAEQRTDILHIEHHSAILDALVVRCEIFDIRVVSRDDAIGAALDQLFENSLGNRTTHNRLGTRTKLINQHQRARRCAAEHILHIEQVRRVGTQIVVDRLLVADVDKYRLEER